MGLCMCAAAGSRVIIPRPTRTESRTTAARRRWPTKKPRAHIEEDDARGGDGGPAEEVGQLWLVEEMSERAGSKVEARHGKRGGDEGDDREGPGQGWVAGGAAGVFAREAGSGGSDAARGVGGDLVGGGDGERVGTEGGGSGEARGQDVGEEAAAALNEDTQAKRGRSVQDTRPYTFGWGVRALLRDGVDGPEGLETRVGRGEDCGAGDLVLRETGAHAAAPAFWVSRSWP